MAVEQGDVGAAALAVGEVWCPRVAVGSSGGVAEGGGGNVRADVVGVPVVVNESESGSFETLECCFGFDLAGELGSKGGDAITDAIRGRAANPADSWSART
ncbi:hypothetical protein, partial [Dietzia natronolimnaea]|uniref:hypothetical protein n=1 Tax=Dietzia natronolimnaea TaxID=161920 RepID=UPI001C3EBE9E